MVRTAIGAAVLSMVFAGGASAQKPVKIGLIQSLAGAFNTVGKAVVTGASIAVERSPYMVRTSFTLGQSSAAVNRTTLVTQVRTL